MKLLKEKPEFPDGLGMHCGKRERDHKCVGLDRHTHPCYTLVIGLSENLKVVEWYEMDGAM